MEVNSSVQSCLLYKEYVIDMVYTAVLEKIGKMGRSLLGNFVIWKQTNKEKLRETIPHWKEI